MRYHRRDGTPPASEIAKTLKRFQRKLRVFLEWRYEPHIWAWVGFHANINPETGNLVRWRDIVAGRRGGKSFSSARETLAYALHPELYWEDFKGISSNEALWVWIITRDHVQGRPTYITWKKALDQAGLVKDKDYQENKTYKYFEFRSGTLVEFKTADDPDKLVGAGLHIEWWDEASKIRSRDAWDKAMPALSDNEGMAYFTTTPEGKDWVYDDGWGKEPLLDPDVGTVEFWSLDNPYFPKTEWRNVQRRYHPMLFKQQYQAEFDAMTGKDLHGDWLHFFDPQDVPGNDDLTHYIGVDPAISQRKGADRFAIAHIGVSKLLGTAYLLHLYAGHLPFPEQVALIEAWHTKYKPQIIGVESQAYQAALVQQINTLPSFPPVQPVQAKGDKGTRLIAMSPLFRFGRVLIRPTDKEFISEWVDFDSSKEKNRDDTLDAVQIALAVAGAILPEPGEELPSEREAGLSAMERNQRTDLARLRDKGNGDSDIDHEDEYLGSEF